MIPNLFLMRIPKMITIQIYLFKLKSWHFQRTPNWRSHNFAVSGRTLAETVCWHPHNVVIVHGNFHDCRTPPRWIMAHARVWTVAVRCALELCASLLKYSFWLHRWYVHWYFCLIVSKSLLLQVSAHQETNRPFTQNFKAPPIVLAGSDTRSCMSHNSARRCPTVMKVSRHDNNVMRMSRNSFH